MGLMDRISSFEEKHVNDTINNASINAYKNVEDDDDDDDDFRGNDTADEDDLLLLLVGLLLGLRPL